MAADSNEVIPQSDYPQNWRIGQDYDPNEHMMKYERYDKSKGCKVATDYLNVQNRMVWFIRDQRTLIVNGLAKVPYAIHTELVSESEEWAEFKTTVRDVLGNECTMYGSEDKAGFGDYREKASTKSLGRALAMLGYGTQYAPEMDEGERVVDSPVEAALRTTTANTPSRQPAPAESRQNAPQRNIGSVRTLLANRGIRGRPSQDAFLAELKIDATKQIFTEAEWQAIDDTSAPETQEEAAEEAKAAS